MRARRLALVQTQEETPEQGKALRVAFASTDRSCIDQHFGSATAFAVYAIDAEANRFLEALRFNPAPQDGDEGKLVGRIAALEGCHAVYVQAVGASAVGQLLRAGVQPLKAAPGTPIPMLIAGLQRRLADDPAPWMLQALAEKSEDRFDAMEAEDWDE